MTDYEMNAEPGHYDVQGPPHGMNALVEAWHRRSADQWAAAVKAQGLAAGRAGVITDEGAVGPPPVERTDLSRQPDAGALGIEGQKPGVEERLVKLPELLIPATIVAVGDRVAEGQLIEAVMLPWFDIVKALERDPNFVHQLVKNWRIMEELVAGAYHREGWSDVILTPRSSDRGRDIIVSRPDWGTIRIYDQVKAYSPDHPVPAADVRELFGVLVRDQNVSKAVLTTTTLFASGVREEWAAFIPCRLELRDGPALTRWLLGLLPGRS
jgi:restriction system protein